MTTTLPPPSVGDIWAYRLDSFHDQPPDNVLLVVSYNKESEAYTCLEFFTGKYTTWSMRVGLYPWMWEFLA